MLADHATSAAVGMSTARRRILLLAILSVAAALRAFRLAWGLPNFVFNDTKIYFLLPAARAAAAGDWVLDRFTQPPLYPYLLSITTFVWTRITGTAVHLAGPTATGDLAKIVLLERVVTVALATLTVVAIYLLAKRLVGVRAALLAAVFFALCPLHVLESHRVNADTPMLLLAILSGHQAVIAWQDRSPARLIAAFALAALSGTAKYTGLYAGTLPLWFALRWPGSSWRERLQLTARGGLASLIAFIAFMSPVVLNWDRFVNHVYNLFYAVLFIGAPGQDLMGDSWVYAPYLYLVFVGLPFMLGWAIAIAAVGGVLVLATGNRPALTILAAAALPFFVVQGAAETATARYYLPLAPYLAIAAAAFVDWAVARWHRVGVAIGAVIIGYTFVLNCSHVSRIGGKTQAVTGAMIARLVKSKRAAAAEDRQLGRRLVVGYPVWTDHKYDAIKPHIENKGTMLRFFPPSLRMAKEPITAAEALELNLRWAEQYSIDVIVFPGRYENLRGRNSFTEREELFYQQLIQGKLGFRLVLDEKVEPFWTQGWYDWGDPTLDTLWTAGIGGYKLFARDSLALTVANDDDQ